ncbi:SAM hydrolase/SAM-dependent halogenase family protein [Miltoncostaea marina]|uniref:SAM hydrolase/SAM-dependent halogenase family protein n=1 Tax=Miltoncostaea marina TaxID=2843215 RepID=UPI001C3E0881|nr:SAM-dependent chlorinase/fluorinase [Miltoncostaea marina]
MTRPVVTLLTDFGAGSEHVGALHAVLAAGAPGVDRVDLAHDLPPGDIRAGALVLARLAPLVPGAVHLAVVDPGVGTADRRPVAVALAGGGAIVGPDNGLLGLAARALIAVGAVELPPLPEHLPATFHGRDLFAPVAARLVAGEPLSELGEAVDPAGIAVPALPEPRVGDGELAAEVVMVDRFGNVQLLAREADLAAAGFRRGDRIHASTSDRRHPATVARAFGDVARKGMLVHIDSHGLVAVAVNGGSAAQRIGAEPGGTVSLGRWPVADAG